MKINFIDVNWGSDEAKGDSHLESYFMKIPDYDKVVSGEKRYIIGRKGTGKTAILEKIRIDSQHNSQWKVSDLTLRDFPLNDITGMKERSMQDKSQFVPIWTFLLLIELSKMIVNDDFAGNSLIKSQLFDILKENSLENEGGFPETIRILKSRGSKISLASLIGLEGSRSREVEYEGPIHFTKAIQKIKELILKIESKSSYYVLFDELDEGFTIRDSSKRLLLLSLFRSVENLFLELGKEKIKFRPVIALRSDIFDHLEDNDLNKYDDFLIRLNWVSDTKYSYSLKDLVNTRILATYPTIKNIDPWTEVCEDFNIKIPTNYRSAWAYLKNRTFERPRDVIKYLKYCQEFCKHGKLKYENILDAEEKFSVWFYNEIRDEIQSHLPVWKEAIGCLAKIGKGIVTTNELIKELEKEKEITSYVINSNINTEDILTKLFEFSVIGNLDERDRWLFRYKDDHLTWSSTRRLTIHFGIQKKLRIFSYTR